MSIKQTFTVSDIKNMSEQQPAIKLTAIKKKIV